MVFALDAPAAKPKPTLPVFCLTLRLASSSSSQVCGTCSMPGLGHDVGVVDHGPGVGRERHAVDALAVLAVDQVGRDEVVEAHLADAVLLDQVVELHAGLGGAQVLDPDEREVQHVGAAAGRGLADELVARVLEGDALEGDADAGVLLLEHVEPGADLVDVLVGVAEGELDLLCRRARRTQRQERRPEKQPPVESHRWCLPDVPEPRFGRR